MTDYPLTRRLLAELGELEAADQRFPIMVLLNLTRSRLRAPLRGAMDLCGGLSMNPHLHDVLGERYPQVRAVKLFEANRSVDAAMERYYDALRTHDSINFDDPRVEELATEIGLGSNHYAAFVLYLLGLNLESRPQGLDLMEALLRTHPAVAEVLLELAAPLKSAAEVRL